MKGGAVEARLEASVDDLLWMRGSCGRGDGPSVAHRHVISGRGDGPSVAHQHAIRAPPKQTRAVERRRPTSSGAGAQELPRS